MLVIDRLLCKVFFMLCLRPIFVRLFFLIVTLALVLSFSPQSARAAGIVTDCSTYGPGTGTLQDALAGGGTITFSCSGTITMQPFTISSDTFLDASGQDVTLRGGVYLVNSGITLSIRHLFLTEGSTLATGPFNVQGGTLIVTDSTITGNFGGNGGGIYNDAGTVTITNSTISGNIADQGNAGGILNANGIVTITNSLISGNSSPSSLSPFGGGAILNTGTLTIVESTISGNSTNYDGGGVFNEAGAATITNSTIYGNSANHAGDDIYNRSGTVKIKNSIVAGTSIGGSCDGLVAITDDGFNLSTDLTCNLSTIITPEQLSLDLLANRGGMTQIHALLPGSVAIDAGNCISGNDQRGAGFLRPIDLSGIPNAIGGNGCDIGAYELQSLPSVPISPPAATPELNYFSDSTPTLTWSRVSWAASYEIDVADNRAFSGAAQYTVAADELSVVVDTPPLADGEFYWRVRALSPIRVGAWSVTQTFTIDVP